MEWSRVGGKRDQAVRSQKAKKFSGPPGTLLAGCPHKAASLISGSTRWMASVRSSSWSTEASQKKRKKKRKTGREVRRKKGREERKERRTWRRTESQERELWSPALTLSSAAVAHVPSPIIPISASESWNCETVRGLLRYPTLRPVLQNKNWGPERRRGM